MYLWPNTAMGNLCKHQVHFTLPGRDLLETEITD